MPKNLKLAADLVLNASIWKARAGPCMASVASGPLSKENVGRGVEPILRSRSRNYLQVFLSAIHVRCLKR